MPALDMLASAFAPLAGCVLILVTLLDVTLTALHVQSESPFSTRLNRLVWWMLVRLTRVLPEGQRQETLGWALPLMLGGTIAAWAVTYILGFALVDLPVIHDPTHFTVAEPRTALEDVLFYSGVIFFSLGSGSITPASPVMRASTVMEGGAGLLTISLAVTYLLNVYPVLSRKVAVADALNIVSGGRADGVITAQQHLAQGRADVLAQRLGRLTDELLYLAHAHRLYPVLYYVRSREVHESFVRILAVAQGMIATLEYGLDPEKYAELVHDPRVRLLEEGLLDALHLLARSSHLSVPRDQEPTSREFDELRAQLARHGLRPVSADDQARARFDRFRDATEPYIQAYARNIGYPAQAVWDTYSRAARGTALDETRPEDEPSLEHRLSHPNDGGILKGGRAPL